RENGDYRLRQQLGMASRNAKLLLRLVDQIIDFRRLEAGKIKLQAMEMDMNAFLKSVIDNFEPLRREKEAGIFVNFPDDSLKLWIDPQKLEQVLYNLLSNAFKHIPREGSIAITLSRTDHIQGQEQEGSWAQISVYNDGKTIPEDDLPKVFERFFKVDDAQLGSGIGLAYSRSLVDLHRGHINVENRQESGVVFNVYLPRGKEHLKQEEFASADQEYAFLDLDIATKEIKSQPDRSEEEKQKLSLLVVEDNDELRDFFRTILAERYDFHEASNGSSGYEIAKEVIPDIIISDLLMPEMNGFELCEKLKNNEKTSHIPIILLTAKNTPEDKITGYKSGADAFVVKPFEISVLDAHIGRLIENRAKLQEKFSLEGNGQTKEAEVLSKEDHFINRVKDLIEKDLEDPELNVNKLSEKINLSSTQLYRKIKAVTGQSSVDFIKDYRLTKSAALLKSSDRSVKEICFMTGFKSPSYFVKCFKVKFGSTPREFASNTTGSSAVSN
ncbi:MAG: response regulator, partial [Bacteroidales bacterium]|nr:response regulator [Bacteroidales bacterium]